MDRNWKLSYVRWLRIGNWWMIPIYIFMVALPGYFDWQVQIPPDDELNISHGELTYRDSGRRGRQIGLKIDGEPEYFTCSSKFGGTDDCFIPRETLNRERGQPATIWWFDQPIYPYLTQRRVVKVMAGDRELVSRDVFEADARRQVESAPWYAFVILVVFVLTAVYFERQARKIEYYDRVARDKERGSADS